MPAGLVEQDVAIAVARVRATPRTGGHANSIDETLPGSEALMRYGFGTLCRARTEEASGAGDVQCDMRHRGPVFIFVLLLGACAAVPATPSTPSAASTPAIPTVPVAQASLLNDAPTGEPMPVPLKEDEQSELASARCKSVVAAYESATASSNALGRLGKALDARQRLLTNASNKTAATAECTDLLARSTFHWILDTMGVDARQKLQALAEAQVESRTLCPSTQHPVPDHIPAFYEKLPADAEVDPAFACLRARPDDRAVVQLEVRSDASVGTTTFIARGSPLQDGKVVEWTIRGRLKGGAASFGAVERSPRLSRAMPSASAATSPTTDAPSSDGLQRVFGVRFEIPKGWSYRNLGPYVVVQSPAKEAGFVLAGYDDLEVMTTARHAAEKLFDVQFDPSGMKRMQNKRLSLVVASHRVTSGSGTATATTFTGKGPRSAYLALFSVVREPVTEATRQLGQSLESLDVDAP